ncbi:MAG: type II secretion system secretin GspD [Kiloniellaceae bacterium]
MSFPAQRFLPALVAVLFLAACARDDAQTHRTFDFGHIVQPDTSGETADRLAGQVGGGEVTPREEAPDVRPQIFPGSGRFVQSPRAADVGRSGLAETDEGEVTLNFADTEIREVARIILGETLGLNYSVDSSVQGTVTLRTNRPIPREALLPTLETLLDDKGYGLIEANGLYQVLALGGEGGSTASRVALSPALRANYGTEVFPLRHAAANQVQKVVTPLLGEGAQMALDEPRNILIVTGSGPQRQAVAEMVAMFDTDWMAGMSFALLPVASANPALIVQELEAIFGLDEGGPQAGLVRFVPIERLGVILAIARRLDDLELVRQWVARLDRGTAENGRRLYVYYAQHTRVEEVVPILQNIFQQSTDSPAMARGGTSGLLATGLEPVRIDSPGMALSDATAATSGGAAGFSRPRATESGAEPERITERGIHITADEVNNAVFILATPRDYHLVEAALESIDLVPLQVLIEATIAEVTLNDELRYGVQWFLESGDSSFTLSAVDAATPAQVFPGFSYLLNASNARVVLNALASVTDVNVVSSPQLMVLDNRSATLQVGDQVPVATQSAVAVSDSDAPIVNEIEFRDTGVILTVTPRVNAGGTVNMDIEQEVSDVVETTSSGIDSPTIRQRRISSTVAIQSGQTIALGGLIRDGVTNNESGIPVLSDIPVLGNLFKSTTNTKNRTELLILITPVVIRDDREALALTEQLRRRLQSVTPIEGGTVP